MEDVLYWGHHNSGAYVTKTGHHWLEKQTRALDNSSKIWKKLATLKVLPKIRIFGWRVGNEALPVGRKLQTACLGSGICKLCEQDIETVLHAVRECPKTQEAFVMSDMDSKLPQGPFNSGFQWLEEVVQMLDANQFQFLIILIWNVWNRRNRWIHQNQLIPTKLVVDYAQLLMGEMQGVEIIAPQTREAPMTTPRWTKPAAGRMKINVDGAWSKERNIAAIGVVARDQHGWLLRLQRTNLKELTLQRQRRPVHSRRECGWQNRKVGKIG
ncbi:hypothetical protein V6N11_056285 [Hibiscus sabdariffa]|uniref:Reverse transcriptase zinc-binding domain-containing protein n=1 Tax=Hibiscus sabdariffa TaxID=183260 RepID=A0ABR2T3W1_9ROSI